jgi:hypothetical protein
MSNSVPFVRMFATALTSLCGAVLLSGCAAPAGHLPTPQAQGPQPTLSAQEHDAIALEYERRAAADAAAAERHGGFALVYRRNKSMNGAAEAHEPLARHCEDLAQAYLRASGQKFDEAKLHRDLARQTRQQ